MIPRSSMRNIAILNGAAILLALGQIASAQPYKSVGRAIMDGREVNKLKRQVNPIVRGGGALSDEDRTTLKKYYLLHVVAGMTRPEAETNPQQYPAWRKAVVGDLETMAANRQKHDFVRDLIFNSARRLVDDREYSPACRYNAVVLIGELNSREATGPGRSVTPAVPYAPARKYLLEVFGRDESDDIKVGAMLGLARHARLMSAAGANPDPGLVTAMVGIVQQEMDPESNSSSDGQEWMQRIAIDALGDIGQSDKANVLEPVIGDDTRPISLRCTAAAALGRLDTRNADKVKIPALLKGLGQLAAATLTQQIQQLQQHIADNPPDRIVEDRFRSDRGDAPEDPFVRRIRRQLTHGLMCVGRGIQFVQQASTDTAIKNAATSLLSEISAVVKALDDKDMTPQDLFDKIGPPAMRVESAVKKL